MRDAIGARMRGSHPNTNRKIRSLGWFAFLLCLVTPAVRAGTITGTLDTAGGIPVANGTLTFTLRQAGIQVGSGAIVPVGADCYTSSDGSIVGLPDPLINATASVSYGAGSLPAGLYYIETTFYSSGAQETLPSPEARLQLVGMGTLIISPPTSWPANATGMRVYIGASSGGEQLQGQTSSASATFSQGSPLGPGAAPPIANRSVCSIAFNDTIIPYTGYDVSLLSANGNAYPGWPQAWQLNGGPNGTVDLSQGAPLWNGVTIYPQPIVAQPLNHGPQSISGVLNLSGYNLVNTARVGVGTPTPSWPIDVENGAINASGGYLVNGGGGLSGQCLVSNGIAFLPGTCFTPSPTFYQTVESGGILEPQEPIANFSSAFTVTDSGSKTNIDLAPSGVTAGSYINANITVNAKGQVTTAANGSAPSISQEAVLHSGICTTGASSYSTCDNTVTWGAPFADANYSVTCSALNPSDARAAVNGIVGKSTSGVTVRIATEGSVAVTYGEIDCIGVHP